MDTFFAIAVLGASVNLFYYLVGNLRITIMVERSKKPGEIISSKGMCIVLNNEFYQEAKLKNYKGQFYISDRALAGDTARELWQQFDQNIGEAADQWHEYENNNPVTTAAGFKHMNDQG